MKMDVLRCQEFEIYYFKKSVAFLKLQDYSEEHGRYRNDYECFERSWEVYEFGEVSKGDRDI
jgi:hypothetical protein